GGALAAVVQELNPGTATGGPATASPLDPGAVLTKVRSAVGGKLGLFNKQEGPIAELITARDPIGLRKAGSELFAGIRNAVPGAGGAVFSLDGVNRLQQLIGSDIGTVLPLATIANAMQGGRAGLKNVEAI